MSLLGIDNFANIDSVLKNINRFGNDLSKGVKEPLHYITLQLYVSSGFFIRQYIRGISEKIGIPLMCYDINRVNINY